MATRVANERPGGETATFFDLDPGGAGSRPCVTWVIWEEWYTREDERVCPVCGPLDGRQFARDKGPQPPLHVNCRCERREAWRECASRAEAPPADPDLPHDEPLPGRDVPVGGSGRTPMR